MKWILAKTPALLVASLLLLLTSEGYGQVLPVRTYGVDQGLPHEWTLAIEQDRLGYM